MFCLVNFFIVSSFWLGNGAILTLTQCNTTSFQSLIDSANWGDMIKFSCSSQNKITLTSMIYIDKSLTIDGENAFTIDGNNQFRQFLVGYQDTKYGVFSRDISDINNQQKWITFN